MEYTQLLSEVELSLLRSIIGRNINALYTGNVEIESQIVTAPAFSFELGNNQYCVIESDWRDTPESAIDYHEIHVSLSDWPKGIGRLYDIEGRSMLDNPSVIRLLDQGSQIVSIVIYEVRDSDGSETVHYDYALIFTFANGYQFVLAVNESIAGGLYFSEKKQSIEEIPECCSLRIALPENAA